MPYQIFILFLKLIIHFRHIQVSLNYYLEIFLTDKKHKLN